MDMHSSSKIKVSEIQALCKPDTFMKGTLLAASQAVHQLKISGDGVIAKVNGTDTYRVHVQTQPHLMAQCTCPAAEYQPFCKHAVAVALSINGAVAQDNADNERKLVREYLLAQGEAAILDQLLDYLEDDDEAWQRILTKITLSEKSVSYGELKKLVTKALPREHIWDWREVGDYFHFAEEQLKLVFEAAQALDIESQWKLMSYTVERLNTALEHIDDSNGERFGVEELINTQMPAIFEQLPWNEEQKAEWMFERLTSYEFDVFPSIEEHFELNWRSNPAFLTRCCEAINNGTPNDDNFWDFHRWAKPLIDVAQSWREVVDIKQKIAHRCSDYLEITSLYIDNDEALEAEYWLAKAKKVATGYEQQRCDEMQVKLYVGLGEISQAWRLNNRLFSDAPSYPAYQRLAEFKTEHEIEDETFLPRVEQTLMNAYQAPNQYGYISAKHDALVQFYIDQQAWEKACDWVAGHKTSIQGLISLADHIVDDKPENTLDYYLRAVAAYIEQTNNSAYDEALALLKRVESMLKAHPIQLVEFYCQVAQLAVTYKRKRNMLTLLQQHYAQYF